MNVRYLGVHLLATGVSLCRMIDPATAQAIPHIEKCTLTEKWSVQDGRFGVSNVCGEPVAVQFMDLSDKKAITAEIKPGERYNLKLSKKPDNWMFTTCPVGYVSNIAFRAAESKKLQPGDYACVKK